MTDPTSPHPRTDQLVAFGLGKLDPAVAEKIAEHLDGCDRCSETIIGLEDDTFVSMVRDASSPLNDLDQPQSENQGSLAAEVADKSPLVETSTWNESVEPPSELGAHPRYEIVELIGRGGMGDVYKAQHRLMNRVVALKVIKPELVSHEAAVARFRREVQAAARLHHPNIVTAHDAEQAGNLHYLVMEFVDGINLDEVLRDRGSLSVESACKYIRQAAEGLQHAHELGMVHRDIKPQNLMLDCDDNVKILDFGLASLATETVAADDRDTVAGDATRRASQLTMVGAIMGTPDYMSPEQATDAHSADIRADIYCLGCTLYYLLTGEPPFSGDSALDKIMAHVDRETPSLSEHRNDIPGGLESVLRRMMAKNPDERFQTPEEVVEALRSFAAPPQPGAGRAKTRKKPAISALLLPLLLAAGVVIYLATDTGMVEIDAKEINAPGATVVLLKNGKQYASFEVSRTSKLQRIRAGKYEVQLRGASPEVRMNVWSKRGTTNDWGAPDDHQTDPVVVYRGGGMLVRVTRIPAKRMAARTDYDRLQGFWKAESVTRDGQALAAGQNPMDRVEFDTNKLTVVSAAGVTLQGTFRLDTSRNPKQLWVRGRGQNVELPCIYRMQGNLLTLCMNRDPRAALPTEFSSKPGSRIDVIVFRRDSTRAPVKDDIALQGKWVPVSAHFRGKALTAEQLARMSITLIDNRVELTGPDSGQTQVGTFRIDANASPKRIDFIAADGKEQAPGIFEFDGARLKLAWNDGDYARPTNFQPAQTPDHITAVLKRATVDRATLGKTEQEAVTAAEAFLAELDKGRFGAAYDLLAPMAKRKTTRDKFSQDMIKQRDQYGKVIRRMLNRAEMVDRLPQFPRGSYAIAQYLSDHSKMDNVWQSLMLARDSKGRWQVMTIVNSLQPASLRQPQRNKTPVPPRQTPTVRTGVNLIHDPSLEATRVGSLPRGWSRYIDTKKTYRLGVVEGGRTGQKSLELSGQASWVVGGRFLLFRTYDDEQHESTLAFMTYEPNEKSYRYWHFAQDVIGAQWRITWEPSSRAFHWRSIDMPQGWIGSGFNRWGDENTFDTQALIKDSQGRVLMDAQSLKRRTSRHPKTPDKDSKPMQSLYKWQPVREPDNSRRWR